jgi:hypothetical protein
MACEESSWQKYEPPTIRVELNPKTILIATVNDRKNLRKIFAAAIGGRLWAADRNVPGLFQPGLRSMLRPLEQLGQPRHAESDAPRPHRA